MGSMVEELRVVEGRILERIEELEGVAGMGSLLAAEKLALVQIRELIAEDGTQDSR